jgi:acyl dehydratase
MGVVKPGWAGRYFEDFDVGDVYRHALGRTVLPTDNAWFTLLTQNTAPIHFDAHYASQTEWGKPLVGGPAGASELIAAQSAVDRDDRARDVARPR